MIDNEEKGESSSHVEHAENSSDENVPHSYDEMSMANEQKGKDVGENGNSKLRDVTTIDEVHDNALHGNSR